MTKQQGEPFVMIPLRLLESEAWRALSINGRRLIDRLMVDHMRHRGKANGSLLAPYDQLVKIGITRRLIGDTIEETTRLGLVECRRGYGRSPNRFALTWLPFQDGTEPSNRWKSFETPAVVVPDKEPLQRVPEGELVEFPKGNYKARSGSR